LAAAAAAFRFGWRLALRLLSAKIAGSSSSPSPPPCDGWPHFHVPAELARSWHSFAGLDAYEIIAGREQIITTQVKTNFSTTDVRTQAPQVNQVIMMKVCRRVARICRGRVPRWLSAGLAEQRRQRTHTGASRQRRPRGGQLLIAAVESKPAGSVSGGCAEAQAPRLVGDQGGKRFHDLLRVAWLRKHPLTPSVITSPMPPTADPEAPH
jgi:hypothetical protein